MQLHLIHRSFATKQTISCLYWLPLYFNIHCAVTLIVIPLLLLDVQRKKKKGSSRVKRRQISRYVHTGSDWQLHFPSECGCRSVFSHTDDIFSLILITVQPPAMWDLSGCLACCGFLVCRRGAKVKTFHSKGSCVQSRRCQEEEEPGDAGTIFFFFYLFCVDKCQYTPGPFGLCQIYWKNMFTSLNASPISQNKYLWRTLLINPARPKLTHLAGRHSCTQIHQEIHQLNGGGGGGEGHNHN